MKALSYVDLIRAERIGYLIARYITDTVTPEEAGVLERWLCLAAENRILFEKLAKEASDEEIAAFFVSLDQKAALQRVKRKIGFGAD